MHNARVLGS